MADIDEDAFKIAKYMYDNKLIGSRGITVAELKEKVDLSSDDFDIADEYLLGAGFYDGTMGGDAGQR